MRTSVANGLLIAVLLLGGARSEAIFTEGCCACVFGDLGHSGGLQEAEPALFCALVVGSSEMQAFAAKCEAEGGSTGCFKVVEGQSCTTTLAEVSVGCPAVAGAPTASGSILALLGAGLAAAGVLVLRRRRA